MKSNRVLRITHGVPAPVRIAAVHCSFIFRGCAFFTIVRGELRSTGSTDLQRIAPSRIEHEYALAVRSERQILASIRSCEVIGYEGPRANKLFLQRALLRRSRNCTRQRQSGNDDCCCNRCRETVRILFHEVPLLLSTLIQAFRFVSPPPVKIHIASRSRSPTFEQRRTDRTSGSCPASTGRELWQVKCRRFAALSCILQT